MPMTSEISVASFPAPTTNGNPKVFSFTTDPASDCLCLYATPSERDVVFRVQITDSAGTAFPRPEDAIYYEERITHDQFLGNGDSGDSAVVDFSVPVSSIPAVQGNWTGRIHYDAMQFPPPTITVAQRIARTGTEYRRVLPVNLVLYSSGATAQQRRWIERELQVVQSVYQEAAINCQFTELQVLPRPAGAITDDFWSATAQLVLANAKTDQLTVLFIENLQVKQRAQAGKAGGIPGPQGFRNRFAAVLVRLTTDPSDPLIKVKNFLGYTIAHEMGHYLGLTHDSAVNDNTNLMYPKTGGLTNGSLNQRQVQILQKMPLVQIEYSSVVKTPITSVQVIVTTGTTWPGWVDGPGTNMTIVFTLMTSGPQLVGAASGQAWVLKGVQDLFAAGARNTFDLGGSKLFVEDVHDWRISCLKDYSPSFLPDDWHFQHLTLRINNVQVDDFEPDVFISNVGSKISHTHHF